MLNQTTIVGRLIDIPEIKEDSVYITLAVPRSYKNSNGEYDTDFIPIKVWKGVEQQVLDYITKGDLIGIKGMIQNNNNQIEILAEKITFLSNKKGD